MNETHPNRERLRNYSQGRLSQVEMDDIEQHLAICDSCAQQLDHFGDDTLLELVRAAGHPTQVNGPRPAPAAPVVESSNKSSPHDVPTELIDHARYRVLQAIGMGGMGVVYKAEHRLMERLVALKVIHRQFMSHPTAVERFRQEVKAAGRLAHPNIVTAHDAEQAGELHFLAMEYVEGVSMARLIEQKGPLSLSQACHFIRQAAIGLQHAHERGMVHRDIKPQNLMVTRKGQVKILDFGLARFASEREANVANGLAVPTTTSLGTRQGSVLGTPDFMSPEQWRDPRTADARADIFSLGCTLFYLLVGRAPRLGRSKRTTNQPTEALGPALSEARPDAPPALVKLVTEMTAENSEDRPDLRDISRTLGLLVKEPAATPVADQQDAEQPFPVFDTEDKPKQLALRRRKLAPTQLIKLIAICCMGVVLLLGGVAVLAVVLSQGSASHQGKQQAQKESVTSPIPTTAPVVAAARQPNILLVVPSTGLWYEDYAPTRQTLEKLGAHVVVASTSTQECKLHSQSRGIPVEPHVALDQNLRADDYDAVVFSGFDTTEFRPEGVAGKATSNLLRTMLAKNKPVAAICVGQEVLLTHGLLRGKSAAKNIYIHKPLLEESGVMWIDQPFVQQGHLLMGRTSTDAEAFAQQLMKMLAAP